MHSPGVNVSVASIRGGRFSGVDRWPVLDLPRRRRRLRLLFSEVADDNQAVSPKRVLYYYSSLHFDTGSPRALASIIDQLDRAAFQPVFLACGEGPLVDVLKKRNVEIFRGDVSSVSPRKPLRALKQIMKQARLLRDLKIDLIHVNEFGWDLDLVFGARYAKLPVILHLHNPAHIAFQNLNRFVASKVIVVSEFHKTVVTRFDRIAAKTEVLYNAIDLGLFAAGRRNRADLGIPEVAIVAGTVGQICHRKGIDILLDVAGEVIPLFPRLHIVVVGSEGKGETEYAQRMIHRAGHKELDGRVHFVGPRADIPAVLASFDVFVFPTRSEMFSIALIEAMGAGLPVVGTRVGGNPEIVTSPDVGWLVQPGDAKGFSAALEEVLRLPDLGRATGLRGKATLTGKFDQQTSAARLATIYADALRGGTGVGSR